MKLALAKKTTACLFAACMAAQPAFGAVTDLATVPLGTAAGSGYLPNLLFTLDNSGSMAWEFLPDYVDPSTATTVTSFPCMSDSANSTDCTPGDPPYSAGGQFAMNGVAYDPNFTYLPGLDSNGQPHVNPPSGTLTSTSVTKDAYLGGGTTNLTTSVQDRRFCNTAATAVCKRNGADNSTAAVLPAGGTDVSTPTAHTLAAGQFPWRTHSSNSSTMTFALPEMMPIGQFIRNTTGAFVGAPTSLVRVTTVEPHGLSTGDLIYTAVTNMPVTCVAVTKVDNNNFTYSTGATTAQNRVGTYRKCVNLSNAFVRASSSTTVTVTSANHGLVVNDIITTANLSNSNMNANSISAGTGVVTAVTATTFQYASSNNGALTSSGAWVRTGLYNVAGNVNGSAISYKITPIEYCSDVNLTTCVEVIPPATPPAGTFPAYVRFCKTQADALATGAVTGTSVPVPQTTPATPATARCQAKFVSITGVTYQYPRFGWFNRDTITSGVATYVNRPNRVDCVAAPTCTYTEEIQNYSKWYAYYRSRLAMMKTSAGRAFLPFVSNSAAIPAKPDRLRVGFITIHVQDSGTVDSAQYLKIDTFNTTQASNWFTKFYAQTAGNATPLREALSRAGWIFGGKLNNTGLTKGIPAADDPMQASCQKNFTFLTTDGFWNGNAGQKLDGTAMGNQDNVDNQLIAPYTGTNFMVSRTSGTFDGNLLSGTTAGSSPGGSGTLADVAMYYYETDLRGGAPAFTSTSPNASPANSSVAANNVQAQSGSTDFAVHQHMTTYAIGLADGLMRYQADYDDPAKPSDFNSIRNALPAAGNCFWTTGTCNWPAPQQDNQSAIDDLWHAAVNGRGRFYSALNPTGLSTGLSSALNNLNISTASAAAAATSSPQVSQQGTKAFSTTYQTSTWSGEVYAQAIDPQLGTVITTGPNDGKIWEAQRLLVPKANAGTRRLLTFDAGDKVASPNVAPVASKLKDFRWTAASNGALTSTEKSSYFLNKCVPLTNMSQCSTLTPIQLLTANDGTSLLDYLSGKATNEGVAFRDRTEVDANGNVIQTVLGDVVNAQPLFIRPPFFDYDGTQGNGETIAEAPGETYTTFRTNNLNRAGLLLIGANDGFLHGFDPLTGDELWAYTPRFLMPNLYQLADSGYPGQHRFYVDGTPVMGDVFDATAAKWKTVVVGGTNSGGRGFYAIDVTDPLNPKGLWEFCASATLCPNDYFSPSIAHSDPDLGFSFGNPVIGRRKIDGKWVVVLTSGVNNVSTGTGQGYFYVLDAITGQILHKVGTGTGDTTTPSGLMKVGAYYPSGLEDPLFTFVYGGDQNGQVWRLDISSTTQPMLAYPTVTTGAPWIRLMATLKDGAGRIQPLTAKPAGTHLGPDPYDPNATRIYYVGTGRFLGITDLSDPGAASGLAWQQSLYAIRDQLDNPRAGFNPSTSFRSAGAANVVQQTMSGGNPDRFISKLPVDWKTQDGVFVDLNPKINDLVNGDSPGERVVLDVKLVAGTVIFTSTIPKSGCEPGGDSFQYFLDYLTLSYVGNDSTQPGGIHIGSFLVGTALEQTADDMIKALNKTISGANKAQASAHDFRFGEERFGYRER